MRMTWDEFKAHVDQKIAEQGADGSVEVWYIDVTYPDMSHPRTEVTAGIDVASVDVELRLAGSDSSGLYISTY